MTNFIEIFTPQSGFNLKSITIPNIQRDYAQGRTDTHIIKIRDRFLKSLHDTIINHKKITLDFIYGSIDKENSSLNPLDGQQRLTTLFLLHWYAAKKEGISSSNYGFLKNFTYETRYSAREFCQNLVDFTPTFNITLSEDIINQYWFPLEWQEDPTISSMLTMLNSINEIFYDVPSLWSSLESGSISFSFLTIEEMKLTDELYIKMNSRGKPLTPFEHFKAELERELSLYDKKTSERIMMKIDTIWTDMLWKHRDADNITDDEFIRYYKFICDILYFKNNLEGDRTHDEFELIYKYFSKNANNLEKNILTLEAYFDCWVNLNESSRDFLQKFISTIHEKGKITVKENSNIDIFEECLKYYGEGNAFSLQKTVLLYAIILYITPPPFADLIEISPDDFKRRLRIVNNLIKQSTDELRESRMNSIFQQVERIIYFGNLASKEEIGLNFNDFQLKEEKAKIDFLITNNDIDPEIIFTLEDHDLLDGQISILGLDNINLYPVFSKLYECDWDKVDCAFMAIGFYGQIEPNRKIIQLGTSSRSFLNGTWYKLFHKSDNSGVENTRRVLVDLLSQLSCVESDYAAKLNDIIANFIYCCENINKLFTWEYYYVKYSVFRPGRYGKYFNYNFEEKPYETSLKWSPKRFGSYSYEPFIKTVADNTQKSSSDGLHLLTYKDLQIKTKQHGFDIIQISDDWKTVGSIIIPQKDNVDIKNRVEILEEIWKNKSFQNNKYYTSVTISDELI